MNSATQAMVLLVTAALLTCLVTTRVALCDEESHTYMDMEPLVIWADKIGPYNNPHETYAYRHVPICELWDMSRVGLKKSMWIGELLEGHNFVESQKMAAAFGINIEDKEICAMTLTADQANELKRMVDESYSYVYYIDDLPVQQYLGEVNLHLREEAEDDAPPPAAEQTIFTHRTILLEKNKNQIISVDIAPSKGVPIVEGAALTFTYSVKWSDTAVPFADRFNRYLQQSFFEQRVHWFSVVNSVVLCLFLCAVVVMILTRTLKNDFAKYAASDAAELESLDRAEESGWKQVHGDVFRRPAFLLLFSVIVSNGWHIVAMVFLVAISAFVNSSYTRRGMNLTATFLLYALTQVVNGAWGGYTFRLYGGKGWRRAMLFQLLAVPVLALALFGNTWVVATVYQSSMAIPLNKLLGIGSLFFFVCVPLHVIGTRWGRARASRTSFPCRVHQLKRPIPAKSLTFFPVMLSSAGLVPFGCIFVEMYFVFQSVWSYDKFYFLYGFILVILVLFCSVLVCVSITCTYVLLHAEDYRWPWTAMCCCASASVYIFLYSLYYFYSTHMSGLLQSVHFFSSTIFLCCCIAMFCGAVGYAGASRFVSLIYKNIKSD